MDFLNIDKLRKVLPYTFKSEGELLSSIKNLTNLYTTDRQNLGKKELTDKDVSAYAAFYFTTNFPKWRMVFELLPRTVKMALWSDLFVTPILDIGCGPATFTMAILEHLNTDFSGSIQAIDSSTEMLKLGQRLVQTYFPHSQVTFSKQVTKVDSPIIFFGNSLNEMGHAKAAQLILEQKAKWVLALEPGTKEAFQEMLSLRTHLLQAGYKIHYPCMQESGICPMQDGVENWCHQVVNVRHDTSVERYCQILGIDRRRLPLIWHVYSRSSQEVSTERVTRYLGQTKFSYEFEVCGSDGDRLTLKRLEFLKRGLDKSQKNYLESLYAGAALEYEVERELADKKMIRAQLRKDP